MKIQCFSLLSNYAIDEYESRVFESGVYKWKLIIYPNGDTDEDYTFSVSFSIADIDYLPAGWEVNAIFAFFIHNQIKDNYVCFRGPARRFNAVIPRWGLSKLISKETLMEPTNGYVADDNCVFGAEVLVVKSERVNEFTRWFTSSCTGWGFHEFVSIADMTDDCCFVEIEITLQAVVLEAPEI
ncbi:ubiquitin C-terminal hydrolase 13-like [Salvia splendens]|uniref:ubiquitin C-terminal hydrolase 13-like n=1 Tax=Salvia splendens TaxID=180675 RepID=UPI001C257FBC|nr:ubiquitin C-terminal hydrolase 13-like [Salvia splendens]